MTDLGSTHQESASQDGTAKSVPASRYLVFFSIVVIGCLTDLATKSWIFSWLGMPRTRPPWVIWRGFFSLTTSLNEGALFGLGQGWSLGFAALSIVAAVAIVAWLFWARAAHEWALTVALALIMAGIFGNLYDRLGFPGLTWNREMQMGRVGQPVYAVRDWLLVTVPIVRREWPIFNLADSMLVVGASLLFLHLWVAQRKLNAELESTDEPREEAAAVGR